MDAQTLVPLYLTVLMVVLSAIALIGGRNVDKKKANGEYKETE